MSEGIDDILSGHEPEAVTEPEVAEAAPVEAVEPEAEAPKAEQPRGPDGKFAPKGEKEDAPPASEDKIPVSAIQDERRKRQELERRLAEYEARLQQLSNPPQPAPDMFENPEGFTQHLRQDVVSTAVQQATLNAKLDMSEMMVRQANPDFEEMKEAFLSLAQENPVLAQQALSDPHPWNKAYQIAKNHKAMTELGATDVDSLRASIRAELEAELKAQAPAQPAVDIPQTLATAQSGRTATQPPAAPPSLSELLGR